MPLGYGLKWRIPLRSIHPTFSVVTEGVDGPVKPGHDGIGSTGATTETQTNKSFLVLFLKKNRLLFLLRRHVEDDVAAAAA